MSSLPDLHSGDWGAVDYRDMNRVFRHVERDESEEKNPPRPNVLRTFWAKLISQETINDQPCWTFAQIGKLATAQVDTFTGALTSIAYPANNGRAIDLSNSAAIGDRVLMHELVAFDSKRWFAFTKGGGTSVAGSIVKLLTINSASANGADHWDYIVTPAGEASGQTAQNLYEGSPWGHGQPKTFASLGTLTVGPVSGTVIGLKVGPTDWRFDSPNPLTPVCAT